jgi:hypothetical protein
MNRRRFTFWMSFGMFTLSQKLRVYGLDELAAAMMGGRDALPELKGGGTAPIHWRAADNDLWQWYERETFINGRWTLSGITTPLNKETGARQADAEGYLDDELVPQHMRRGHELVAERGHEDITADGAMPHAADPEARARHGRPPSKWLRSLNADELRIWLRTIDVPEAGVSGMTTWVHLTRDHSFEPENIEGLAEDDQSKLHAAAHYGY